MKNKLETSLHKKQGKYNFTFESQNNDSYGLLKILKQQYAIIYGELTEEDFSKNIGLPYSTFQKHKYGMRKILSFENLLKMYVNSLNLPPQNRNICCKSIIKYLNFHYDKNESDLLLFKIANIFYKYSGKTINKFDLAKFLTGVDRSFFVRPLKKVNLNTIMGHIYHIYKLTLENFSQKIAVIKKKHIFEHIKKESLREIFKFILDNKIIQPFIKSQGMEELKLIFDMVLIYSEIQDNFFSLQDFSIELGFHKNWLTNKFRTRGNSVSRFTSKQREILRSFFWKFYWTNTKEVIKIIKTINWYQDEIQPRNTERHTDWNDLYAYHCYVLLIEQAGFDALTLEPLYDMNHHTIYGWCRHHINEDKLSINSDVLALVQVNIHQSSIQIPHKYDKGIRIKDVLKIRAEILYNRKVIKNLILNTKKDNIKEQDLPNDFKAKFKNRFHMDQFIYNVNLLREKGEYDFFFNNFNNFYIEYVVADPRTFWNTHCINYK